MQPRVEGAAPEEESAQPRQKNKNSEKSEKSSLVSRNVTIGAHRTSIRLEPDMWVGLREICRREHVTLHDIATLVAGRKGENTSLTAAIRVFVMAYFRAAATEEGHSRAGHGPGGSFMAGLVCKKMGEQDELVDRMSRVITMRYSNMR
jgi:predicted DNA-binding ribbon-helix-helix protein